MAEFPGKGKVAVLKTSPQTVLDDIEKLMRLADFETSLPKDVRTGMKINVSWQTWYPACSSTPWQIEGMIRTLQKAGYKDLVGVHNDTVVVNTSDAEINNKHTYHTLGEIPTFGDPAAGKSACCAPQPVAVAVPLPAASRGCCA